MLSRIAGSDSKFITIGDIVREKYSFVKRTLSAGVVIEIQPGFLRAVCLEGLNETRIVPQSCVIYHEDKNLELSGLSIEEMLTHEKPWIRLVGKVKIKHAPIV